jgi:hypothetical protein
MFRMLQNVCDKASTELDGIPTCVINASSEIVVPDFKFISNLILSEHKFPI